MHLHFEKSANARCDCPLLSLTWMGKVPDEMPADEEGWKLNRNNYYQEGWLATGNVRGVVGVTFTSSTKTPDIPLRTNYNLRGHRTEVSLVKWNEPYQKLASCDSSGIIFVWIKYEGRWSIELINDRNTQVNQRNANYFVTDFSWSHDGRMALICYQDGFVLVGSVAGQRYWSSMLDIEGTITCGIWSPDDRQVLFGTSDGQIVVMDVHGVMVAQLKIIDGISIISMGWSCEKFKMEEDDEGDECASIKSNKSADKQAILAVCFKNGLIYIMRNYDDVSPVHIVTGLKGVKMEWTNAGDLLAVGGATSTCTNNNSPQYTNYIQFYTDTGRLRHSQTIPSTQHQISAITWGHNDKRIFIATGPYIHVGWVTRKVATLQLLSQLAIYHHLSLENQANCLSLPKKLLTLVVGLFTPTLKTYFPKPHQLKEFVSRPPEGGARYHCTMIRHDDEICLNNNGTCYTLYLEYLGGLVPLLKGKRSSKIRPEFTIYDPQVADARTGSECSVNEEGVRNGKLGGVLLLNGCHGNGVSNQSDSDTDDGCASPRLQRRRKQMKKLLRDQIEIERRIVNSLAYVDTLPEHDSLVIVTSNIWGTKFKINGVDTNLPTNLGQVTYKTSLLHLQPRQMTLSVTELGDDVQLEMDVNYNPHLFSEEEDDNNIDDSHDSEDEYGVFPLCQKEGAPIAPMTPRQPNRRSIISISMTTAMSPSWSDFSSIKQQQQHPPTIRPSNSSCSIPDQPSVSGESDEYVDFTAYPDLMIMQRDPPNAEREGMCETCAFSNQTISNHCDNTEETPVETRGTTSFNCHTTVGPSTNALPHRFHPSPPPSSSSLADNRSTSFISGSSKKLSPTLPSPSPGLSRADPNQRSLRWAEKACELKFIDDDEEGASSQQQLSDERLLNKCRSHSVGQLSALTVSHSTSAGQDNLHNVDLTLRELKRRLILSGDGENVASSKTQNVEQQRSPPLVQCGKSRSLDSKQETASRVEKKRLPQRKPLEKLPVDVPPPSLPVATSPTPLQVPSSPRPNFKNLFNRSGAYSKLIGSSTTPPAVRTAPSSPLLSSSRPSSPLLDRNILNVASPTPRKADFKCKQKKNDLRKKSLLNSPLLSRRSRRTKVVESSDDEVTLSGDEAGSNSRSFSPNNSFKEQNKANNKIKKERVLNGSNCNSPCSSPCHSPTITNRSHRNAREFIMHNKAPLWNENSQVYQLDFGGRVTQESAKNFQIEFRGKQVMQFGRIDGNAYTLDFQYPFTAIQAFAVALANVTQRLK